MEVFDAIDTDGSGTLSCDELSVYLTLQGIDGGSALSMIAEADVDGDGTLDFAEFRRICLSVESDASVVRSIKWSDTVSKIFGKGFASDVRSSVQRARITQPRAPAREGIQGPGVRERSSRLRHMSYHVDSSWR